MDIQAIERSAKRAFADAIPEAVEAISIELKPDGFTLTAYSSTTFTESDRESIRVATTEIVADFNEVQWCREDFIENADEPFIPIGQWIYQKYDRAD
jgi:hypothetical protein